MTLLFIDLLPLFFAIAVGIVIGWALRVQGQIEDGPKILVMCAVIGIALVCIWPPMIVPMIAASAVSAQVGIR